MEKKSYTWEKFYEAGSGLRKQAEDVGALRLFVDIAGSLEELFECEPELVKEEKQRILWLVYPDKVWEIEEFVEEYGAELAAVSEKYPVTISGMTSQMDMGTLEFSWDQENRLCCRKCNFKGTDFERMESLGMKIVFDTVEAFEAYGELFAGIHIAYPYTAVSRRHMEYLGQDASIEDRRQDTYYCYIPVSEDTGHFFLDGLSIEQKKKLWLKFLRDGVSPLEFAYINQALAESVEINMFELELALHMAMAAEGITIEYREEEFRILDKSGQRKWFSYQSVLEAEKLCMKILFPEIPVKNRK